MHIQVNNFCKFVKNIFNDYFINKKVLDVGSGDINGNNNYLFENCDYNGNDVVQAKNVTIVSKTKDLPFPNESFDTIISTECFEHDPTYKESLLKIYDMLKPNGLFLFTCATTGRPVHGVKSLENISKEKFVNWKTMPNVARENWDNEYYKNLVEEDIRKCQIQ